MHRALASLALLALPVGADNGWAETTQTTNVLNLHSQPGIHYKVTAVVPSGASIDILECDAKWCGVAWSTQGGYVERRYLLSHVTVRVPPLNSLEHDAAARDKATPATRIEICESQWGLADLNGDGILDGEEADHYNSMIRTNGQPVVQRDARLDEAGFVAACSAPGPRE